MYCANGQRQGEANYDVKRIEVRWAGTVSRQNPTRECALQGCEPKKTRTLSLQEEPYAPIAKPADAVIQQDGMGCLVFHANA